MNMSSDTDLKYNAQKNYCATKKLPMFAPINCYFCNINIYDKITIEKASSELITGCPHCHHSFVD
jgi:hypothetical protein